MSCRPSVGGRKWDEAGDKFGVACVLERNKKCIPAGMNVHEMIDSVRAWQLHYNMTPRNDSRLTELYANGNLPNGVPPDAVARELMCTDFLYKYTLYGDLLEEYMRLLARRLRAIFPHLSWSSTWTIVKFYGPIALKLQCVESARVRIPDRLP